ncbi:hypothetical protein B0H67DRAFT_607828 [Lasiosphaeris hirsuta]|uniref:Uncharacterized protein n=1 Tax=Lasiosphaeris hirsuta TaxID=260670 RepID=A0AA40B0W5_9PEZI|nr:hypothetical protein B0H67DRAFT_607828 [Lasiosphaeris hirsuta]
MDSQLTHSHLITMIKDKSNEIFNKFTASTTTIEEPSDNVTANSTAIKELSDKVTASTTAIKELSDKFNRLSDKVTANSTAIEKLDQEHFFQFMELSQRITGVQIDLHGEAIEFTRRLGQVQGDLEEDVGQVNQDIKANIQSTNERLNKVESRLKEEIDSAKRDLRRHIDYIITKIAGVTDDLGNTQLSIGLARG